jgi:NHL repeat
MGFSLLKIKSLYYNAWSTSGNGSENLIDGKLSLASLAQPTGITRDEVKIYFLDSEVSALRSLGIKSSPIVKTIIGKGLFEFGDIDGLDSKARLQFPMGITYSNGKLYLADTLNHKIKQFDLEKNESITLVGSGISGAINSNLSDSTFFEPQGIAVFQNIIYIADTNNHLIRVINLHANTVTSLEFNQ